MLSAGMLFEWLAIRHDAPRFAQAYRELDAALDLLLADPKRRTADLGGPLGTAAFTQELVRELEA